MNQINKSQWRKLLTVLALFITAVVLNGCEQKARSGVETTAQPKTEEYDGLSRTNPIRIDTQTGTVTILAQVNGRFLNEDTRHGIVFEGGSNGDKSILTGLVDPKTFHDALLKINAKPGNNMTFDNKEATHVTGSKLEIMINWAGADRPYSIDETIIDSNSKKFDMHFGGNLQAAEDKKSGCLVCLDSCPVGIVSNAAYTYGAVEKRSEVKFIGNKSILPPDATLVTVTFRVIE